MVINDKCNGKKSKIETEILKNIEHKNNIKLIQQHRVEVDNKLFFIDGYDKENNIAYEIDEKYHMYKKQQQLDKEKDYYLQKALNCQIIRVKNY